MKANENSELKSSRTLSPNVVAAIIGIVAFLGPIDGQFYSGWGGSELSIMSFLWTYYSDFSGPYGGYGGFVIEPYMLFTGLILGTLRPVFAYMMYRLYNEKTTKRRALIVGVAAELQLVVIMLIAYLPILLSPYPGMFYIPIVFPIPILILVGLAIINVFPPKVSESWVETEESKHWWEKSEDQTDLPLVVSDTAPKPESADNAVPEPKDDWLKEN